MNEWSNKRILVTGATGLIGSHLVERLIDEGAEVIAAGRNQEKLNRTFDNIEDRSKLILKQFDVTNEVPADVGILDYVFHAASPISGKEIVERPLETIKANIDGVMNILDYLLRQKLNQSIQGRMVVFSSATVYGSQRDFEMVVGEDETNWADALHTSNTPYSESKRMIEVLSRAYLKEKEVDSVIARIAYVYGYTYNRPNTAFYEFINAGINGKDIVLKKSGLARRDNIYVNDVINGLLTIALHGKAGESYNISSNGEKNNFRAIDELAEIIARVANKIEGNSKTRSIVEFYQDERKPGMKMDNTKLKLLGWDVRTDIETGIINTYKKFKKERDT